MAEVFTVPVTPRRNQKFGLTINGMFYNIRLWWSTAAGAWVIDIYDADNVPLLMGIPLVTGANILGQFEYLNIAVNQTLGTWVEMLAMTFVADKPPVTTPTFDNFGVDSHLYYIVRP